MKLKTIALSVILILMATVPGEGQATRTFYEVKGLPDPEEPSSFDFTAAGASFHISDEGKGSMKIGDREFRFFDLHLSRNEHLVRAIYHADYHEDLLLLGEVSDSEYGSGFLSRLDTKTSRLKWTRSLAGFNVGPGLVDDKYAYVTAIGFIGKINLESGAYVWRHSDLYERYKKAFNSFVLPEVRANSVVFRESPDYLRTRVAVIIVDRTNGKVLKVNL